MAAEKRVADYVLQNAEQVVNLTIEELAAESRTSYATIVRVCKRLGYSGYKEFKNNLISDVIVIGNQIDPALPQVRARSHFESRTPQAIRLPEFPAGCDL